MVLPVNPFSKGMSILGILLTATPQRKEGDMAIKAYIKRTVKEGKTKEALRLLIKARSAAMGREGYISSETLSSCKDPNTLMVVSLWQNEAQWLDWKQSDDRKVIEDEFAGLLAGPVEYDTYYLGLTG